VSTCDRFEVIASAPFGRSVKELRKLYYPGRSRVRLDDLIERVVAGLEADPRPQPPNGHLEPWPRGKSLESAELWKLELSMPGLAGASSRGRLIYILYPARCRVTLVCVYTHNQYRKRPDDKLLDAWLRESDRS